MMTVIQTVMNCSYFISHMTARTERRLNVLVTTHNPSCVLDELSPWSSLDIDHRPENTTDLDISTGLKVLEVTI